MSDILEHAREHVLENGLGLDQDGVLQVLQLPDADVRAALDLAHEVRMRWCGAEVEVESIISLKTGGCPEDCHFCAQAGQSDSPVRSAWLDIPELLEAARAAEARGATEFCIVAAVRGPDRTLMSQLREAVPAILAEVNINVNCSLGLVTPEQAAELAALGVRRYNHNLETARSFFDRVVTTHTWEERRATLDVIRGAGLEVCCGGIIGMGETLAQRAEFAVQLAQATPDEVPLNFLNPRPGTPFADLELMSAADALRAVAAFRLAMPRSTLRFAGGREVTLGQDGTREGLLGGVNGVIAGNYLTTLGSPTEDDLALLRELQMPVKPCASRP